jgi:hypothetical protein
VRRNFLGALLSSFDSQFDTASDNQDSLFLPSDGRGTAGTTPSSFFFSLVKNMLSRICARFSVGVGLPPSMFSGLTLYCKLFCREEDGQHL